MSTFILEFEKPIVEMEEKLEEVKRRAEEKKLKGGKKDLEKAAEMEAQIVEMQEVIEKLKHQIFGNLSRWERVQLSRHPQRPYTLDYIEHIAEDFIELFGDRAFADDKAIVGGFGRIGQQTVMFIGQQKGRDTKSRQYRNFGMPNPEGYRKALRLMKIAEKFEKPVVTLIDTPGAFPGLEAEERGQGEAIARNLLEMARLKVPIICIVIGEGASGGALGIGVGDRIYQLENTWYSVISPESCSSILWRSWDHKEEAAEALKLTAEDNLRMKIIDGIIPEPLGGAHKNPEEAYKAVKEQIKKDIKYLKTKTVEKLIEHRIAKFSAMGFVEDPSQPANGHNEADH
ncbi:MAG: acetyl-CoA carboxylase carboxyltransferase subunit alpha [Bacteroidetes bacterium]|nr:acetyl-CoA carboxylase carboxyltransferase subunit alpha [Bacteroidota bacterium]MBL0016145.1 acetyl-CoA carboxylase carboxyltransferase subunit alpha [Bacteroidota bacterium]